jgi:hypothetical protein
MLTTFSDSTAATPQKLNLADPVILSKVQMLSDSLNQLSFISALVGGFAIALLAGLLTMEQTRLSKAAIVVQSLVGLLQISCTLYFSLVSFRLLTWSANGNAAKVELLLNKLDPSLGPYVLAFFSSFPLFFTGVAITGWIFGKRIGWAVTIFSVVALLLALNGVRILSL